MKQYQELLRKILSENTNSEGVVQFDRDTRSGKTCGIFGEQLSFDMRDGFPIVTTKYVPFKSVVGEALWFLNGENTLTQLRYRSEIKKDTWTIWSNDHARWNKSWGTEELDDLGNIYGSQWRGWYDAETDTRVDQISDLILRIKEDPMSRYHVVSAWNVADIKSDRMALPACHNMFQVYVTHDGYMDLIWNQRSADALLGVPFNIASYGFILTILAKATGYTARMLKVSLGDVHIYQNHYQQVLELLSRNPKDLPTKLQLPKVSDDSDFFEYISKTASAYSLVGYNFHPAIKAPLSVG